MNIEELNKLGVPDFAVDYFKGQKITSLNSAQVKAVNQGLLEGKNMLVCTPTGSGKTAIATFAIARSLSKNEGSKALYLVPLRALASEKYREYKALFKDSGFKVAISTGELDSADEWFEKYDVLILTVEKMDSVLRHNASWVSLISTIIVDEVHLLNDVGRGPTLEILLTILKQLLKNAQIIALSATIGNAKELAEWLNAQLVIDDWRPVKLHKGVYLNGEVEFE